MTTPSIDESFVLNVLRQVFDPELDCNIVDLGLIYDIQITGGKVRVIMTLTTPGCPMHESIRWGVQNTLLNLEGIDEAEVDVVWDPPWNPAMMTAAGRERTGVAL